METQVEAAHKETIFLHVYAYLDVDSDSGSVETEVNFLRFHSTGVECRLPAIRAHLGHR